MFRNPCLLFSPSIRFDVTTVVPTGALAHEHFRPIAHSEEHPRAPAPRPIRTPDQGLPRSARPDALRDFGNSKVGIF